MQTQKGFTLIELLVVIAIIGILAGMVVVNMRSAPEAAKNAKLQSYFAQLRTAAAIWVNSSSTYVGFDSVAGTEGKTLKDKIEELDTTVGYDYNSVLSANAYCARGKYVGSTKYWCIDSNGFSGETTSAACTSTGNATACQ